MDYRHIATFLAPQGSFTRNITDLRVVTTPEGARLIAATHIGGGIGSFALSDAGSAMSFAGGSAYSAALSYLDTPRIAALTIAGRLVVNATGLAGSGGFSLGLDAEGRPVSSAAPQVAGAIAPNLIGLAQYTAGGQDFLVSVENDQLGYTIWQLDANGLPKSPERVALPLTGVAQNVETSALDIIRMGAQSFIVTASAYGNLLTVQEIRADGSTGPLRLLTAETGMGLSQPTKIETVMVAGIPYIVVAAAQSSSLTVFRLSASGDLLPVDHIIDERSTRFAGVTAMTSVEIGGRAFVILGGRDDGISVFTVMPGGQLLLLETLADRDEWSMAKVSALAAAQLNGALALFVSSRDEPGITQLAFDPGKIGRTATVGAGAQSGTADSDMLRASSTTTSISAGDGDDILISGSAPITLTGGKGRDIFVLTSVDGRITITDFESGVDRIDLSNLGMIRSMLQLKLIQQPWGMRIAFGTTVLDIRAQDGRPIAHSVFTNAMFPHAHYPPPSSGNTLYGSNWGDSLIATGTVTRLYGMGGNDILLGSSAAEYLSGGAGKDTLSGGGGNDTLDGGEDNDLLSGNDGNDRLFGREGNDRLRGGAGHDHLDGGLGNDNLEGEDGNDRLSGGGGNDLLYGGAGDDLLSTTSGDSTLYGGIGNDTLTAGAGRDLLKGGTGHDLLRGGAGNDTLGGESGDDRLYGGAGKDTLYGHSGRDRLWGDEDNDRLFGGPDNDGLSGGLGNDSLDGGTGDDALYGGRGNDSLLGQDGHDRLFGGAEQDWLWGGSGNDRVFGGDGDDRLYGGSGNDLLEGEAGADRLFGHAGKDRLYGQSGNDSLWGGTQEDSLYGGTGHDWLYGDQDDDWLAGHSGNDRLYGGSGRDRLDGGAGDDTLSGGSEADLLKGGSGKDRLFGGIGNDSLSGGSGADYLMGGAGRDVFLFRDRADFDRSIDIIADFTRGQDKLDLRGLKLDYIGGAGFSADRHGEIRALQQSGRVTVAIDLNGDGRADLTLHLLGVKALGAGDFLL